MPIISVKNFIKLCAEGIRNNPKAYSKLLELLENSQIYSYSEENGATKENLTTLLCNIKFYLVNEAYRPYQEDLKKTAVKIGDEAIKFLNTLASASDVEKAEPVRTLIFHRLKEIIAAFKKEYGIPVVDAVSAERFNIEFLKHLGIDAFKEAYYKNNLCAAPTLVYESQKAPQSIKDINLWSEESINSMCGKKMANTARAWRSTQVRKVELCETIA